jgi:hypothetical protein
MTSVFLVAGGAEMDVGSSSAGAVPVGLVPAFFFYPALTCGVSYAVPAGLGCLVLPQRLKPGSFSRALRGA